MVANQLLSSLALKTPLFHLVHKLGLKLEGGSQNTFFFLREISAMQTGSKFANYIDRWKKDVVCKTDLEIFVKTAQKQKENAVRVQYVHFFVRVPRENLFGAKIKKCILFWLLINLDTQHRHTLMRQTFAFVFVNELWEGLLDWTIFEHCCAL